MRERLLALADVLERDADLMDNDPKALYIYPTEHMPVEIIRLTKSRFRARLGIHATIRMREVAAELREMAEALSGQANTDCPVTGGGDADPA